MLKYKYEDIPFKWYYVSIPMGRAQPKQMSTVIAWSSEPYSHYLSARGSLGSTCVYIIYMRIASGESTVRRPTVAKGQRGCALLFYWPIITFAYIVRVVPLLRVENPQFMTSKFSPQRTAPHNKTTQVFDVVKWSANAHCVFSNICWSFIILLYSVDLRLKYSWLVFS